MSIVVIIMLGVAIGWAMAIGLRTEKLERVGANVLVGVFGALIFPVIGHEVFGTSNVLAGSIGVNALVAALLGALAAVTALYVACDKSLA